jgi:hypothetical protein
LQTIDIGGLPRIDERISISSDGKTIVSASERHRNAIVWNSVEGRILLNLDQKRHAVISHDGKTVAARTKKGRLDIYSTPNGALLRKIAYHAYGQPAFSPSGRLVASNITGHVEIFRLSDGKKLHELRRGNMGDLFTFSPDERHLLYARYNVLELWDVPKGRFLRPFGGHANKIKSVSYSSDGKVIASACKAGVIRLWRTSDFKPLITMKDHTEPINCIAFSPDGSLLASGSNDHTVKLWEVTEGKLLHTFNGHANDVTDLVFLPDGKNIVSTSLDGTKKVWNIDSKESITVVHFPNGEWYTYSENGRFDCSSEARKNIHFVKGTEVFEPEQLWSYFFTPELMAKFTSEERLPQQRGLAQMVANTPTVRLSALSTKTEKDTVIVRVTAKPGENGLGRIFLYHNDKTIDENTRGLRAQKHKKTSSVTFTITLLQGANKIVGAAFDRDGTAEGRSIPATVIYKPVKTVKPDLYVLSCGISNYQDPNIRLEYPVADAESIAETFKRISSTLYGNVYTTTITDSKASRTGILDALREITMQAKPQDAVVVFLAGHGEVEGSDYYYLPHEAEITDLSGTCVSESEIGNFISYMPATKIAIFLDTCKSGEATKSLGRIALERGGLEERRIIANLARKSGCAVFSASSEDEAAFEIEELEHGIFTYAMLKTLSEAKDIRADGIISISELLGRVSKLTREIAYEYLRREQSPIMYVFGEDFAIGK